MQQVTTANTSWDGLEKYTGTILLLRMNNWNKPRKRTTDRDCVTPKKKKKKKKKGAASHQRPRWWIAKTAAATGNIQDWQESTTEEQLLFWDCKTNKDFYGHGDDGIFAIKANNQAMTLLPARNRRASQLTINHKTHLQQQLCNSQIEGTVPTMMSLLAG